MGLHWAPWSGIIVIITCMARQFVSIFWKSRLWKLRKLTFNPNGSFEVKWWLMIRTMRFDLGHLPYRNRFQVCHSPPWLKKRFRKFFISKTLSVQSLFCTRRFIGAWVGKIGFCLEHCIQQNQWHWWHHHSLNNLINEIFKNRLRFW